MGKIRVKTIGDEGQEEEDKKKAELKRAEKKAREAAASGEEITQEPQESIHQEQPQEASEPQTESTKSPSEENQNVPEQTQEEATAKKKAKREKFSKKAHKRSTNYTAKVMEVDRNKTYSLSEALELLRKVKMSKFDETVELHINTTEAGINGTLKLPHGNGKEVKVVIADDEILAQVEKGKINFDILIATPSMMPKLGKVARVLGPRGLMPNPKNGTISEKPEEAMKKFQGGQINFKTETKTPIIHLSIGKTSFPDTDLTDNIKTTISAIKKDRIRNITLKSTMSPAIKLTV